MRHLIYGRVSEIKNDKLLRTLLHSPNLDLEIAVRRGGVGEKKCSLVNHLASQIGESSTRIYCSEKFTPPWGHIFFPPSACCNHLCIKCKPFMKNAQAMHYRGQKSPGSTTANHDHAMFCNKWMISPAHARTGKTNFHLNRCGLKPWVRKLCTRVAAHTSWRLLFTTYTRPQRTRHSWRRDGAKEQCMYFINALFLAFVNSAPLCSKSKPICYLPPERIMRVCLGAKVQLIEAK